MTFVSSDEPNPIVGEWRPAVGIKMRATSALCDTARNHPHIDGES